MNTIHYFPITGRDRQQIFQALDSLKDQIQHADDLSIASNQWVQQWNNDSSSAFSLMVIGQTKENLAQEIHFMKQGVEATLQKGGEWKTPQGSYFSATPLGKKGEVAFVYPGIGSAYVGLGRNLPALFPNEYARFSQFTGKLENFYLNPLINPENYLDLSDNELQEKNRTLRKNLQQMTVPGVTFSVFVSMILAGSFEIIPHAALGYSLGEISMYASLGVWNDPMQLGENFRLSPLFSEQLLGKSLALRQFWNIDLEEKMDSPLWDSYTLPLSPLVISTAIVDEPNVFITLINTPNETVIAGKPADCLRVIKKLDTDYFPLRLDLCIHAPPTYYAYDEIVDLFSVPTEEDSEIQFYSSAQYRAIENLAPESISHGIAKGLCEAVDFPRLIRRSYKEGVRIFIELGARDTCTKWIHESLADREHCAVSINTKGTPDELTLARLLAQLVSHQVSLNLTPILSTDL